jgi:hypothetical protein
MIRQACVTKARFCTAAWVGAAALFVVNGVRLVTSPLFDAVAKDQMATIRFPPYYLFGFVLVGTSFVCVLWAGSRLRAARRWFALALLAAALGVMTYDWFRIYQPLAEMVTTPGLPRSPEFMSLHRLSEMVNSAHVGLVLVASILLNWPGAERTPEAA